MNRVCSYIMLFHLRGLDTTITLLADFMTQYNFFTVRRHSIATVGCPVKTDCGNTASTSNAFSGGREVLLNNISKHVDNLQNKLISLSVKPRHLSAREKLTLSRPM